MTDNFVRQSVKEELPALFFDRKFAKLAKCAHCYDIDFTYDVGALGPDFRYCRACIERSGTKALKHAADQALAFISNISNKTCKHCGGPVIQPDRGFAPLMCGACMEAWKRLPSELGVA